MTKPASEPIPRTMNGDERSLGSILAEIKDEVKDFLNTRAQVMKAELQETIAAAKVAVPLSLMALALFWTGFLLFTAAAVVLVASAFPGRANAWFFATIIVGFLWICLAAIAAFFAYNAFRSHSHFPQRTIEILKADKIWVQTEARSH